MSAGDFISTILSGVSTAVAGVTPVTATGRAAAFTAATQLGAGQSPTERSFTVDADDLVPLNYQGTDAGHALMEWQTTIRVALMYPLSGVSPSALFTLMAQDAARLVPQVWAAIRSTTPVSANQGVSGCKALPVVKEPNDGDKWSATSWTMTLNFETTYREQRATS